MEAALIEWLRAELPGSPRLRIGLGDDAAALDWKADRDCVVTTDLLTDQIDFILSQSDPQRIGRKALAVNLSDLAAMAAEPVAAFVSLALPRENALPLAKQLYLGMLPLAEQFNVVIAGGDTNSWDGPLVISVMAIGAATPRGLLRRGGAKPGDWIVVTGSFGGSILGGHFDFIPRVREALLLNDRYEIHAATDVSDGLSLDLSHVAAESGCGAELEPALVPISADARRQAGMVNNRRTALEHALSDGEDFELILAVPPVEAARLLATQPLEVPLTRIGTFVAEPGLWSREADQRRPLEPRGYQHEART